MATAIKSSAGPKSTGLVVVNKGKRRLNKSVASRAGKAFVTVRRADGLIGHKYPDGEIVWLEAGASNKARYREALRRAKRKSSP